MPDSGQCLRRTESTAERRARCHAILTVPKFFQCAPRGILNTNLVIATRRKSCREFQNFCTNRTPAETTVSVS